MATGWTSACSEAQFSLGKYHLLVPLSVISLSLDLSSWPCLLLPLLLGLLPTDCAVGELSPAWHPGTRAPGHVSY